MRKHGVGDVVRFTVRRGKRTLVVTDQDGRGRRGRRRGRSSASFLETALDIHLPFKVRIDAGNVGGPSAGLAFALEVMEELGRDVVHGHRVAATGEIFPDGSVGPIGGIKQKTIGARQAHVDAFLVPAGDNAARRAEARGRAPDHPCGELSTGVARPGDTRSQHARKRQFSAVSNVPETARFPF